MEQYQGLMDTLARQPQRDDSEGLAPMQHITLKPSTFSTQLRNLDNFVGAAFHSEQGRRDSQEDRCVLLPDVSAMKALEGQGLSADTLEQLKRFSVAAVFDGHSGWRCAQYLSQNLVPSLVLHPKFLDKQPDAAVLDVFKAVDDEVCAALRKERDSSGSTGVVVVYDGRRHVLTVANVGDSMCVLSRGGRAVRLHRMHRLGPEDAAERARVENAGGAVINNR
jgi:serine/threonine protein phosphatase PrpC